MHTPAKPPTTPKRRSISAALSVALLATSTAGLTASGASATTTDAPGDQCAKGTVTQFGQASVGAPITSGSVVGDHAYTASRFAPIQVATTSLATRQVTGTVTLPSGGGAWAMTDVGSDLYVGTYGPALLYRVDPATGTQQQVAKFEGQQFVFDSTTGSDGKVYVGTYPTASVYSYDPESDSVRSYGVVDPGERYTRSIAFRDGQIYAGTGSHAGLIQIDAATGEKKDILPVELHSESFVYDVAASDDVVVGGTEPSGKLAIIDRADPSQYTIVDTGTRTVDSILIDGTTVYFSTRSDGTVFSYDLTTGSIVDLGTPSTGDETRRLALHDGDLVGFSGSGAIWSIDLATGEVDLTDLQQAGHPVAPEPAQSILSAGHKVHIGGHWQLTVHDPRSGTPFRTRMPGEPKAMIEADGTVYAALYPSAQIWAYDADAARPDPEHAASIPERQMRPLDMAYDPDRGDVYVGTQPAYGELGGALAVLDTATRQLTTHRNVVDQQSIQAVDVDDSGTVYLGSSISGGIGATPVAEEAHLAAWDPATERTLWEIVPVPGAATITDIKVTGRYLVGVANTGAAFTLDRESGRIVARATFPAAAELLVVGSTVYGTDANRVYTVDPVTLQRTEFHSGLGGKWYTGPHLVRAPGCGIYTLQGFDLVRIGTRTRP